MKFVSFLTAFLSAVTYFIFQQDLIVLAAILLLTVLTRFRAHTRDFGKFVEILFIFYLISFIINNLGIAYPYSLIIVLTGLTVLIFYEGPAWGALFFSPGQTQAYFKQALLIAVAGILVSALWIYFRAATITNPVPTEWPLDTLMIIGIGFAFYKAVVEEMIFRSFIYQRVQATSGDQWAVGTQAVFYGFMFYRVGTPSGIEGVVFGSLLGLGLGYLVSRSKSIYLAMMVQFLVTLGTFCTLAVLG